MLDFYANKQASAKAFTAPIASGGAPTAKRFNVAATDNSTLAKAGATQLLGVTGFATASVFLKLYNKATAPLVSDVPVRVIYAPLGSSFHFSFKDGIAFPLGLGYRVTTAAADNDATLPAVNVAGFTLDYA